MPYDTTVELALHCFVVRNLQLDFFLFLGTNLRSLLSPLYLVAQANQCQPMHIADSSRIVMVKDYLKNIITGCFVREH